MSFPSAIAGPSRLPLQAVISSSNKSAIVLARRSASGDASSSADSAPMHWGADKRGKGGKPASLLHWPKWRKTIGAEFETPEKGAKAKWLGGDVPFPMNPSFRPPPPLGNELQDTLYAEIRRGKKTIGQISAEFNVSKARLEAIQKLKEVEEEYKRQSLPLQTAFQEGMEPLLGVQSFMQSRWGRNERGVARDVQESHLAEKEEEDRYEQGIGAGGAFGDRNKTIPGIERTVFEWREEDRHLESQAAGVSEDLFPTPISVSNKEKAQKRSRQGDRKPGVEKMVPTARPSTTWRFVDVSSTGVQQDHQVMTNMQQRMNRMKKRQVRNNRKKGIFE